MHGVFLLLALTAPALLPAQLVRGRVLESGGNPIPRAIVELRRPTGEVVNRTVSGATGSFALNAPSAGRYSLRVAAIGYSPNPAPPFEVPAEGITYGDVRLARVAVTLADLEVLETARCGSLHAGSEAMSRLLDGARTSLEVMNSSISSAGNGFRVQMVHRRAMATSRDSTTSADTTASAVLRWPIEAIDPDSIRKVGFRVRAMFDVGEGHYWFGPDVRVLFANWFLESHCFRVAPRAADTAAIVVEFSPTERSSKVDIAGTLELDPATLALRRLTFEHRNLPRPLRNGVAGGEVQFVELPGGLWLPMTWRLYAPILESLHGGAIGISERSGRVLGVDIPNLSPPRRRTEEE